MEFKNLRVEKKDNGIWVLTMDRPKALNALNLELLAELEKFFEMAHATPWSQFKALIITGSGEKAFVAGADIKEMRDLNSTQAQKFSETGQKVFRQIEALKVPVVAAINGFALGGGLELALSCDFIYASTQAKLGLPEVSLGLIPGFGGTVRLSRVVGINRAREMILSGEMINAEEAFRTGLVNQVVPLSELLPKVMGRLEVMIQRGPQSISKAKFMILESFDLSVDAGLALEAMQFAQLFRFDDTREGMNAFIEKRSPNFKNH